MKHLFIWDFDGTIYYYENVYLKYAELIEKLNDPYGNFFKVCKSKIEDNSNYLADDGWKICEILARQYNYSNLDEAFIKAREWLLERNISPDEYALKIIETFKNSYHVLLTNTPKIYAEPLLMKMNMEHLFNIIIYKAEKPKRLRSEYFKIIEKIDEKPEHIYSIGDNFDNDIKEILDLINEAFYINRYGRKDVPVESYNNMKEIYEVLVRRMN
ncbi:HAD family hydrolase [Caldiplasma sukawensis]